jgi:tetratricopeptide (TPR) repeat protein
MIRSNLLRYFFTDTSQFLLAGWNSFESWLKTRSWWRILGTAIPVFLLASLGAPVLKGLNMDKRELTNRFGKIATSEVEKSNLGEASTNPNAIQTSNSPNGMPLLEIAYRRLLTTEPFNHKARFYVGKVMERRGQLSQARSLMQDLAPLNGLGFAEAHSWLARDIIQRSQRTKAPIPEQELLHHLNANAESANADPELLVVFSSILERQGNIDRAIVELEKAVRFSDKYHLNLSLLYQRALKSDLQKTSAKRAQTFFQEKLKEIDVQNIETLRDELVSQLGLSLALQDNMNESIRILSEGLRKDAPCLAIRKTLSSIYLFRFQKQLEIVKQVDSIDLSDLESAMTLDPNNPFVASLVSQLLTLQTEQNAPIKLMLERNITQGRSSAILHLLLANEAILRKQYREAIPHLEIALSHHPTNTSVLNNLALALVSENSRESDRSLELIDKAISISGETAELLDTKGQILMTSSQNIDAIRCFEKAIALQPGRINSRKMLVLLYERQEMYSLAKAQRQAISLIQVKLDELAQSQSLPSTSAKKTIIPERCFSPDYESSPPSPN